MDKLVGKIHSIETLGALDGPGLRTVIFFMGCPFRCLYCHNPDTIYFGGEVTHSGGDKTVAELVEFCLKYVNYYGDEGGVTLSGGEPLFQREFCLALIIALKEKGINVALDTGGSIFDEEILRAVSLTILDVKATENEMFKKITGKDNTNLLKTIEFLQKNKMKYWARQVVVGGFTDNENEIERFVNLTKGALKRELLPYHDMAKNKYERLKIKYPLSDDSIVSQEKMANLNKARKEYERKLCDRG